MYLDPAELRSALEIRDLSDPAHGPHAMQLVVAALATALRLAWPATEIRLRRGDPVVPLADNYDHLGYAADAVTRDARYTRYVDAGRVLRSHTSALIPPALRELAGDDPEDVLLVCPGVCYRRDSVDWQHTGTPQQLDLWRVSRTTRLGPGDLTAMIGTVVAAALPGAEWRAIPSEHPYTTGGQQIDVLHRGEWIEIGECGLAAEQVLGRAGLGDEWSGLAMGLGLDRLLMLRKGIRDIRLLRSADPRVTAQLLDLEPYREVSHLPPVRRDLSLVVDPGTDLSAEALGDRVRAALGDDSAELVEPLSVTSYDDLPCAARDRLGIRPGQSNLLLRLVLRPLDHTLTDAEANALRDQVYAALHRGTAAQWALR
jgi:phenylalanyl-tRNA synthetase alpha chain